MDKGRNLQSTHTSDYTRRREEQSTLTQSSRPRLCVEIDQVQGRKTRVTILENKEILGKSPGGVRPAGAAGVAAVG